jgi:hypothetical protein
MNCSNRFQALPSNEEQRIGPKLIIDLFQMKCQPQFTIWTLQTGAEKVVLSLQEYRTDKL